MNDYASLFGPRRMKPNPSSSKAIRDPLGRDRHLWDQEEEDSDLNGKLEAARADWRGDASLNSLFGVGGAFKLEDTVGKQGKNRPGDVFKVQSLLHREGFLDADKTDGPTGYWGMFDHEAIEKFQKENGLKVDGWMGPKGETIQAFEKIYAPAKGQQPQQTQRSTSQLPWNDYSGNLLDNDAWDALQSRLPVWYRPGPRQDVSQAETLSGGSGTDDAAPMQLAQQEDTPQAPSQGKVTIGMPSTIDSNTVETQEADRRFERALGRLFEHEGGYVNRKSDSGGKTNHGITANTLAAYHAAHKDQTISKEVEKISNEDAKKIYRTMYFDQYRTGEIVDGAMAEHVMDINVNPGPTRAALWVQQAINNISNGKLNEDGVMGSKTIASINGLSQQDRAKVHDYLMSKRIEHYENIIAADPAKEEYRAGWTKRVNSFRKYALETEP